MIMLKSPSLAINSSDVPGPNYRMWETVNAMPGMTTASLLEQIIRVNRLALEFERTQLLNVVINCHGGDGKLYIGGLKSAPMDMSNIGVFASLKPRNIGTLWLVACNAARGSAGKQFCQTLATVSGTQVVASDATQDVGIWGSFRIIQGGGRGQIDEYEGTVFSFTLGAGMGAIDPHAAIFTILE